MEDSIAAWNHRLTDLARARGSVRLVNCLLREDAKSALPASTVLEFLQLGPAAEGAFLRIPNMGKRTFWELCELVSIFRERNGLADIPASVPEEADKSANLIGSDGQGASETLGDIVLAFSTNTRLRSAISSSSGAAFASLSLADWRGLPEASRVRLVLMVGGLGMGAYLSLLEAIDAFEIAPDKLRAQALDDGAEPRGNVKPRALGYLDAYEEGIKVLGKRELKVLSARLQDQMTLAEIGFEMDVSRERIRQIEKRGLQRFARVYESLIDEGALRCLVADLWSQLSDGRVYISADSERRLQQKLSFPVLFIVTALFGSVRNALADVAIGFGRCWVYGIPRAELEETAEYVFSTLKKLRMPAVFSRLIAETGVDADLAECVLGRDDSFVLYRNVILEGPLTKRKIRLVSTLHLLVSDYESGPVRLMDLHQRYLTLYPSDPCSPRDILIVLQEYPRLFQRAGTFGWINLSVVVPLDSHRSNQGACFQQVPAVDVPGDDVFEAEAPAESSLFSILIDVLELAPLPYREVTNLVRERSSGKYAKGSVAALLASYPEFDFFAPGLIGLYRLRDEPEYISAGQEYLLESISIRQYVLAQLCGSPSLAYPCWNAQYLRNVVEWLYEEEKLSELGSLIDHIDFGAYGLSSRETVRYRSLARLTPARIELPDSPGLALDSIEIKHVVRAAWVAIHCKAFNWMAANRVSGERLDSYRRGPTLIRLLVALGILRPERAWYESHELGGNATNVLLEVMELMELSPDSSEESRGFWLYVDARFREFCQASPWPAATRHEFDTAIEAKIDAYSTSIERYFPTKKDGVTLENSSVDADSLDDFLLDQFL